MILRLKNIITLLLFLSGGIAEAQPLPGLIPYKTKSGWGYCDSSKKIIISPQFEDAGLFFDGRAIVTIKKGEANYKCMIDESGKYIIPPSAHWTGHVAEFIQYSILNTHDEDGRWGIIDIDGKMVIPYMYEGPQFNGFHRYYFHSKMGDVPAFMIYTKDGKQGVVDTLNNELLPFEYAEVKNISDYDTLRAFIARKDSLYGVVGLDRKILYSFQYQSIYPVYEKGLAVAKRNNKMGVIDTLGKVIIPFKYDSVAYMQTGTQQGFQVYLYINERNSIGRHDLQGKLIAKPKYAYIRYTEGYYITGHYVNNRYTEGLLDTNGKVLVEPTYGIISISPDSIVVTLDAKSENDIISFKTGKLNMETFKPIGDWQTLSFKSLFPDRNVCGTGMANRNRYTNNSPYIDSNGHKLYTIKANNRTWIVNGYIKTDSLITIDQEANLVYAVKTYDAKYMLYAIVDKNKKFLIPPQDKYEFTGGFWTKNWLIVKDDSSYAVVDTQLNIIEPFIKRQISNYFTWNGKAYITGPYNRYRKEKVLIDQWEQDDEKNCFLCKCNTMLDRKGGIAKGFENRCISYYFPDKYGSPHILPEEDLIHATDSNNKKGLMRFDGSVIYPEVSFKYNNFTVFQPNIVLTKSYTYPYSGVLVDSMNREYIPGIKVQNISLASAGHTYLPREKYVTFDNLYLVTSDNFGSFYMNSKGQTYADPEAFKQR